ncbi:FG-GAP-like repeat-containing protein [Dyadobacter sp. CY356]|uniref:FG-GAP-like repeat-containing protein n=1 Tax=Dyadobacter sp. CY356 TaxID=2906442 RepID=UPI001F328690|nr:FG-GAP-like repeat-containing protein [Dyadobacter sp. CY356]MCF0057406.1 FG-GAP-like repeat-containing protein [Dyadobacter sp. CY356]
MIITSFYKNNYTFLFLISILLAGCERNVGDNTLAQSKALAKLRCGSCHMFPEPSLLDKKTWREGIMPAMAEHFGIEVLQGNFYLPQKNSTLSIRDWQSIIRYYETLAPDSLEPAQALEKTNDWAVFKLKTPDPDSSQIAATIMTGIDPENKKIFSSSLNYSALYEWNNVLKPSLVTALSTSAVDITFPKEGSFQRIITCMGGMRALDNTKGDIIGLSNQKNGDITKTNIAKDLIRPIETRVLDFNKDGLTDYLVCSFGHNFGGLYILQQLPDKSFKKISVREVPGSTQSVITDFNHDGWPDIMTLFAHANEGIWLFINNKKGGFIEKNVLRFPPVFGSSSFQLVDVNKDGRQDIVYTAGDNSDYSRILKPYHGLYVFLNKKDGNNGNFHFEKSYFSPLNGATKAMAADFDKDGDIDIATIAFFADFKAKPYDTFTYFENETTTGLKFKAHHIPIDNKGRWICMDVNDYDGDGDVDIVLGNYSKGFMNQENFKPDWDVHLPFVVLQNLIMVKD